ncbi:hypothetical protein [Flavobacterium sp. H4147]|uniref:hypothetical protein n=1 Tax=Flavobacterium sp. H4147 TaxID=3034149 RepID=UPI0023EBF596|nr:hypothetical protein [Flavobacterium sp. H4147]
MKIRYFLILIVLLSSCTNNKFYSYVYDYDTDKPIKDVYVKVNGIVTKTDDLGYFSADVKSNEDCLIVLHKEEYEIKKVYRKPDSLGMFSERSLKKSKIYLFKKESDFYSNE